MFSKIVQLNEFVLFEEVQIPKVTEIRIILAL